MPARRDLIAMTPEERRAYIRGERLVTVVANGADGYPCAEVLPYTVDASDRFLVAADDGRLARELCRDPRCAVLVQSGETYAEFKSALGAASAEVLPGDAEGVQLRLTPADFVTWDHTKLAGGY